MAKAPINVSIAGDYNDKDINRAIRDLNSLKTGGGSTTTAMSGLSNGMKALGGVMAATFSVALITDFFGSSISAALADEKAMKSLEIALGNVGAAHQTGAVETFIDALARETGVADDMLRPSFQKLVTATGDVALSQKAVALAMDISAGTGRDLEAVSLALAKGFSGSTTALGKLGAGIDANIIKSKDMDAITAALSQKFAGQAAAAAETYQGKINRVSVAAGEASEQIGMALLKAVDNVSTSMGGANGAADSVTQLGNGFAGLITQVSELVNLLVINKDATEATTVANKYSQTSYRQLVTLIPVVGAYLSTLSMFQERQATASGLAADANAANAFSLQSLRGATNNFTKALPGLDGALEDTEDAASKTAQSFIGLYESIVAARRATSDLGNTSGTVTSAIAEGVKTGGVPEYYKNLIFAYGETEKAAGGAAKATDTLSKAQKKNAETVKDSRTETDAAIKTFTDYRDSVAGSLNGMLDLGAAFESFTERQTNLATAQKALTDFQTSIVGEATESQIQDLAKLQAAYHDASAAAAKGSQSVVEEFEAQGRKLAEFGANLSQLVAAGLGRRAYDAIRGMSADRGAEITAALMGGMIDENVARVNSVYDSINTMALNVGNQAAVAFEQVGLTMASAMIEAMLVVVNGKGRARLKAMLDDLNNAMNVAAAGGPMPAAPVGGSSRAPAVPFVDASGVTRLLTPRAHGGPVSSGRSYMVGEVGPELFTPSRSGSITPNNAMGGNTYQITVTAGVGDPRAIGQQVVEYIKKFEKANGPVFVAA